jgi:signal transduction histidine kinase
MNKNKSSITSIQFWQNVFVNTLKTGVNADDTDETRLHKLIMVITSVSISFAGIIWGVIYIWVGEILSGFIPIVYAAITFLSLLVLRVYNIYSLFSFSQILMILLLPFFLMMSLGGFVNGSVVIVWGFFAPIVALLTGQIRASLYWFFSFVILVLISGLIQPYLTEENNLSAIAKIIFFVINIGTVSFVIFLVLKNFITKKDSIIDLMRQNRELEKSYLQQEVALRESDKLATLGKLSAGMAHELNNPAAASLRGAKQLKESLQKIEKLLFQFGRMNLSNQQLDIIKTFNDQVYSYSKRTVELNPLERSDREGELETWLENRNIEDAWNIASMLVSINFTEKDLLVLTDNFEGEEFVAIVSALHCIYTANSLLEEIGHGTGRIAEIVKSLKSYSYMDQAPIQSVDIHEGLNDTLVMLRSRLKDGITVEKYFDNKLPHILACGSELNQVWTNIIDNAISAMEGKGILTIKTFIEEPWLVVQIKNTGPEIPEEVQRKVFDPFFTTKSPGEGTGLGLNISHNIIVQKHHGKISVTSGPKDTCFQVKLPSEIKED